jgi:putative addiction module component (TIGR02574 family)
MMRARVLAIARGDLKPRPGDPKVWFTSMRSLAEVFGHENRALLRTIRETRPLSIASLADTTGRKPGNLSWTLKTMAQKLAEIEAQALELSPRERDELAHRLIVSLDAPADDEPESIAKAWDEEIGRRVADMDAGRTKWVPADAVMQKMREHIAAARTARAD